MKISVEIGAKNRRDFYDVRGDLIEQDKQFGPELLVYLPYTQLAFCCIGNSGEAVCPPELVAAEKRARRQRFLSLEEEEFTKCESYLRYEEMYDDVMRAITQQAAPHWDDLTTRQQTWAKLHCIWSHLDDPLVRMGEALDLLSECSHHTLPSDVCNHYIGKLDGLTRTALPEEVLRSQIEEIRDNVRDFLPDSELSICQKEQIRGYICTADCFRIA